MHRRRSGYREKIKLRIFCLVVTEQLVSIEENSSHLPLGIIITKTKPLFLYSKTKKTNHLGVKSHMNHEDIIFFQFRSKFEMD